MSTQPQIDRQPDETNNAPAMAPDVQLYTAAGELVAAVPYPFPIQGDTAAVILWGTRVFVWSRVHGQFREGFAYYVPAI